LAVATISRADFGDAAVSRTLMAVERLLMVVAPQLKCLGPAYAERYAPEQVVP
jgi:hypothetical protein